MNIEKLFKRVDCFKNIEMDVILFESTYPIMFTCRDEDDIYLFICCIMNSKSVKWIGTKTSYDTLISLLKDKITIREAFLVDTVRKIIIEYYGGEDNIQYLHVNSSEIPKEWLPTAGEYMDADENEFQEEIELFQTRVHYKEISVKSKSERVLFIQNYKQIYNLSDDYFETMEVYLNESRLMKSFGFRIQGACL